MQASAGGQIELVHFTDDTGEQAMAQALFHDAQQGGVRGRSDGQEACRHEAHAGKAGRIDACAMNIPPPGAPQDHAQPPANGGGKGGKGCSPCRAVVASGLVQTSQGQAALGPKAVEGLQQF